MSDIQLLTGTVAWLQWAAKNHPDPACRNSAEAFALEWQQRLDKAVDDDLEARYRMLPLDTKE